MIHSPEKCVQDVKTRYFQLDINDTLKHTRKKHNWLF